MSIRAQILRLFPYSLYELVHSFLWGGCFFKAQITLCLKIGYYVSLEC